MIPRDYKPPKPVDEDKLRRMLGAAVEDMSDRASANEVKLTEVDQGTRRATKEEVDGWIESIEKREAYNKMLPTERSKLEHGMVQLMALRVSMGKSEKARSLLMKEMEDRLLGYRMCLDRIDSIADDLRRLIPPSVAPYTRTTQLAEDVHESIQAGRDDRKRK